jgi:hypothetical protein
VTGSEDLFARALRVIPGGVNSPVRAFKDVGGNPVFIESAQGANLNDVDGRSFVDFCMAFGPLIFGHGDPDVRAATTRALQKGWSFGTAETASLELAELITANIPWVDSVRFVNSGTEAVMSAIRLARAATHRAKILKFDGCYHGHSDAMLIRAGSGLAGTSRPDSAGVPDSISADTLIAPLDDESALENIFDVHGAEIAAVIIEPVVLSPNSVISEQVDPQRLEEIFDLLEDKLEVAMRDHIRITDKRGPGVMRYRIAISGVNAVKRDPRWFEYSPITFAATQVASAAGMRDDVVELFVEAELTDSVTGNVISSAVRKGHSSEGVGQGEPITEDQVDSLLQQWADSADTYLSNLKKR